VLLALLEEAGRRKRERCEKCEGDEGYEVDIGRSSPRRAKTKKRSGKGRCNIVSE